MMAHGPSSWQIALVVGIDETLERRWGKKISAKGVYRDPVRSTYENFVKSVCEALADGSDLPRDAAA
jgi:predicted hydrolase (HD superfamily)